MGKQMTPCPNRMCRGGQVPAALVRADCGSSSKHGTHPYVPPMPQPRAGKPVGFVRAQQTCSGSPGTLCQQCRGRGEVPA